ncbi:MAG: hypothetical protein ACYTFW_02300 [Planctomycetota bacterium]|jgi:hypothetical protein
MAKSVKTKKNSALSTRRVDNSKISEPAIKPTERGALSGWPMIFGWLAMLIFAIHASTHMVAAGDTWVAMACGRHFVNHGVDTIEPFSANSHKPGPTPEEIETWPNWAQWIADKVGIDTVKYWHPTGWINQNWLTHVIFYSLIPKSSYADGMSFPSNALVYWKFTIYILAVICVYYTGRLMGVNPALCAAFSCFAMFTGRSFLDVRPAGFSNLLVAVFLLILTLVMYRNVLYIWLIVPLTVFWCNVHGGYIYVFIMLVPFVALNLLTSISKKRFLSIGLKGIYHTIAAGFVAFLAVIVFNPFHLTNLTHTFIISVSEHAERWRKIHEWNRAFDWDNPVGTAKPFLVMYILAWVLLVIWTFVLIAAPRSVNRYRKKKSKISGQYQWPKIDLPLIVIAALTIYMAIRSRRFIPIAAIAACPILAMFIDQTVRAVSATLNFHKSNRLSVSAMPQEQELFFTIIGIVAVLSFGTWCGLKFKRVYLDPWPADSKLNSVFMRMTASDVKPFYALKFIKDNKLEGKMLNHWTEGGFIAFGQEPDPNTGRTPLQLFMDGRAQAAYDRKAFDLWSYITSGGEVTHQIVQRAETRGNDINSADYTKIGEWLSEQLRAYNVWTVLMPAAVYNDPDRIYAYHTIRGLERNPDWPLVFFNNKQKLFVDIRTPRGRELFDGIFNGQTIYPDEYHRDLIRAHSWLLYRRGIAEKKKGLYFAIKAFNANPSPTPMLEILLIAARFVELRSQINKFCEDYVKRVENEGDLAKQDGSRLKAAAARLAYTHLKNAAQAQKNTKLVNYYTAQENKYHSELIRISQNKRW